MKLQLAPTPTNVETLIEWHKQDTKNHWMTPISLIEKLKEVGFDFELDAASSPDVNSILKFPRIYTKNDDGLAQSWKVGDGKSVWVNPPYDECLGWVQKANSEFALHQQPIAMLLPSKTETKYFAQASLSASHILFITRRLQFNEQFSENKASFGSVLFIYNGHKIKNLSELSKMGCLFENPLVKNAQEMEDAA